MIKKAFCKARKAWRNDARLVQIDGSAWRGAPVMWITMMLIQFADGSIECSDEFSCKDFTGAPLVNINDGAYVYGACFSQEQPDSAIFRPGMKGVTFRNCNLANVIVLPGNTLVDCVTTRFQVQNDGNDWIIDNANLPVKPMNYRMFEKRGLPMPAPVDIPAVKVAEPVDLIAAARAKVI